jgi:hypothetical protein
MNVTGVDLPPTAYASDDTLQLNLTTTTYVTGTPEVGVAFTAPTSGRVRVTVGGGCRDNGGSNDRVFLSPQIFQGPDASGSEIIVPSVVVRGYGSAGFSTEFAHGSRTSQVKDLIAGETYYARLMYTTSAGAGTADIAAREITVIPVP